MNDSDTPEAGMVISAPETTALAEPDLRTADQSQLLSDAGTVRDAWPEDWRERFAGGDGKRLARLGRFDGPERIFDSYLELEHRYKSAAIRAPFPEDGDADTQGQWRVEHGVPETPAGYFEELPGGLVVGEEDMPGMMVLATEMHAAHAPFDMVHRAVGAWYKHLETVLGERAKLDERARDAAEEALRETYGAGEARRHLNDLNQWLDGAGAAVRDRLFSARTPDGTPLGSDPAVLHWLIEQMREIDPLVTVVGSGAGDPAAALDDEIGGIERVMREDMRAYEADKGMQSRYLELLRKRDRRG